MNLRLFSLLLSWFLCWRASADVPLHYQYVFGPNPRRAKNMKAEKLFAPRLQADLAKAAAKGDTKRMRELLDQGADVNYRGEKSMTPLFWALINGNLKGFKFLLENGADRNAPLGEGCNPL